MSLKRKNHFWRVSLKSWQVSKLNLNARGNFLKYSFLSSSVLVMSGCELFSEVTPKETIELVQRDLFPKATE